MTDLLNLLVDRYGTCACSKLCVCVRRYIKTYWLIRCSLLNAYLVDRWAMLDGQGATWPHSDCTKIIKCPAMLQSKRSTIHNTERPGFGDYIGKWNWCSISSTKCLQSWLFFVIDLFIKLRKAAPGEWKVNAMRLQQAHQLLPKII